MCAPLCQLASVPHPLCVALSITLPVGHKVEPIDEEDGENMVTCIL